jgi:hypothetical protein
MRVSPYVRRLVEQCFVTAAVAFGTVLLATDGNWDKAAVSLAFGAAVRAVYGVLVKPVGDMSRPDAVK